MPELPDLQVFSQNLSRKLAGKRVEKIHAIRRNKLQISEKVLRDAIEGTTLSTVYREGKELYFRFSNGNVLGIHLMLKGALHLFNGTNDTKSTVLELMFEDGDGLAVTDRMGQATATLNPEPKEAPDALSKTINYQFLKEKLNHSRTTVKNLLMDQKIIRGIGNAYSDEILWHARISPFSICNRIPDVAIKRLAKSIKTVLAGAEKKISAAAPGAISGELRDFMAVHTTEKTHSPTGVRIQVDERGSRKTYHTDEQEMFG